MRASFGGGSERRPELPGLHPGGEGGEGVPPEEAQDEAKAAMGDRGRALPRFPVVAGDPKLELERKRGEKTKRAPIGQLWANMQHSPLIWHSWISDPNACEFTTLLHFGELHAGVFSYLNKEEWSS